MEWLFAQTFLLLLTAFFLGAVIACLIRTTFFDYSADEALAPRTASVTAELPGTVAPTPMVPRQPPEPVQPKIETVARPDAIPTPAPSPAPVPHAPIQTPPVRPAPPVITAPPALAPTTPAAPEPPARAPQLTSDEAARFGRALSSQGSLPTAGTPSAPVTPPAPPRPMPAATPAPTPPAAPVTPAAPAATAAAVAAAAAAAAAARTQPAAPTLPPAAPTSPVAVTAPQTVPPAATPAAPPADASRAGAAIAAATAAATVASAAAAAVRPQPASPPAPQPTPASTQLATAATPAAPVAQQPIMVSPVAGSAGAAASTPLPADDLTRIRAITPAIQQRLNELGFRRFDEIARWTADDVTRIGQTLGTQADRGRILQENWIEQAQILAKGGDTYYSQRRAQGQPAVAAPTPHEGSAQRPASAPTPGTFTSLPATPAAPAPAATVAAPTAAGVAATAASAAPGVARDRLQRIRGINAETEKLLYVQGVNRYWQIAGWNAGDIERIDRLLGTPGRIGRENWIEQAQILAKGGNTAHSIQFDQGGAPAVAATAAAAVGATVAKPAVPSAAVAPAAAAPTPAPAPSAPTPPRDNLQRISGIGAETEKLLYANGVNRYWQIAGWTASDVDRVDRALGTPGRIGREGWVAQAHALAKGASTPFSMQYDQANAAKPAPAPAPAAAPAAARAGAAAGAAAATAATAAVAAAPAPEAPRPAKLIDAIRENSAESAGSRSDLSNLRSVRSEALRGSEPPAYRAAGTQDDLKRIRGVGVLIEKKLNSLGITSYEQIANWTSAEIDRISQVLDFKGRIERENWVEQARILASGGQTEFSRRVDKGDVDQGRGPKS